MTLIQCTNCNRDITCTSIKCPYCGQILLPEKLKELNNEESSNVIGFFKRELKRQNEAKCYGEYRWSIILGLLLPIAVVIPFIVSWILAEIASDLTRQHRTSSLVEGIMGVFFLSAIGGALVVLSFIYKKLFKASELIKSENSDDEKDE